LVVVDGERVSGVVLEVELEVVDEEG